MDKRWEELTLELDSEKGKRTLLIKPHFQKISTGWFDTGQYTLHERGKVLGNIYVDLYTNGGIQWDGSKDEFSAKELDNIANHIVFKDIDHLPEPF